MFIVRLNDKSRRWSFVGSVMILYLFYYVLIQFIRLKHPENKSPFETHSFLMGTSVVALLVVTITSGIMFYKYSRRFSRKCPPVVFKITKIVFYFSAILHLWWYSPLTSLIAYYYDMCTLCSHSWMWLSTLS